MILDTLGNSTPKDNTEEGLEVESDASKTTFMTQFMIQSLPLSHSSRLR